jgi:hypothetical protein
LTPSLELVVTLVAVLGVRKDPSQPWSTAQVLIQWQDLPLTDATWELYDNINSLFPDFHLEDNVSLVGAGIVMDQAAQPRPNIIHTYARRKKGSK